VCLGENFATIVRLVAHWPTLGGHDRHVREPTLANLQTLVKLPPKAMLGATEKNMVTVEAELGGLDFD
jgi:hypothetical protein